VLDAPRRADLADEDQWCWCGRRNPNQARVLLGRSTDTSQLDVAQRSFCMETMSAAIATMRGSRR
jgi:hypothetical protein